MLLNRTFHLETKTALGILLQLPLFPLSIIFLLLDSTHIIALRRSNQPIRLPNWLIYLTTLLLDCLQAALQCSICVYWVDIRPVHYGHLGGIGLLVGLLRSLLVGLLRWLLWWPICVWDCNVADVWWSIVGILGYPSVNNIGCRWRLDNRMAKTHVIAIDSVCRLNLN